MKTGHPLSPRQNLRLLLGFLAQPLVAALCGFVAFLVLLDDGQAFAPSDSTVSGSIWAARAFAIATGFVAFFVTPLAALPLFVWMRSRGPVTLKKTLISGALLGNLLPVAMVLLSAVGGPGTRPGIPIGAVMVGTAVGVTCAGTFWWIAGRHLDQGQRTERPLSVTGL